MPREYKIVVPRWSLNVWWDRLRLWKWDVPKTEVCTLWLPDLPKSDS